MDYLIEAIQILNNAKSPEQVALIACMLGTVTLGMVAITRAVENLRDRTDSQLLDEAADVLDKTTSLFCAFFIPAMIGAVLMHKMGWTL